MQVNHRLRPWSNLLLRPKLPLLFLKRSVYGCISLALCILLCTGGSSKPSAGSRTQLHLVVCRYGLIIAHDREVCSPPVAHMTSLSSKQAVCRTHTSSVLTTRRPLRNCGHNRSLLSHTELHRCRRASGTRSVQVPAARQSIQPSTSQKAVKASSQQQPFFLLRSQLANKQVVTRTDGRILGVVDYLIADPNTCMVVALSLKEPPSSDALPGDAPRQIGLMSLKQISDVLLVHDDRVLLQQQLTVGVGYVKMVGTVVKTADGKTVGKVMLASHQHHPENVSATVTTSLSHKHPAAKSALDEQIHA